MHNEALWIPNDLGGRIFKELILKAWHGVSHERTLFTELQLAYRIHLNFSRFSQSSLLGHMMCFCYALRFPIFVGEHFRIANFEMLFAIRFTMLMPTAIVPSI